MASLRFTPEAAAHLREAIREAGGVEVFAIGDVEHGAVTALTVTCRGQERAVTALLDRPRAGQVVIHNHPSGRLEPSAADMALAGHYGDDGVGMVIVDSEVGRSNWVVEPHVPRAEPVDLERLEAFFSEDLARLMPDWEAREGQVEMARRVASALHEDRPLVIEAGTGTGKSLAYLVPAALWAIANETKVVVSTYTRSLQDQLLSADIPLLTRSGLEARFAVLQGRNNYLCKRRLGLAAAEDADLPPRDRAELAALVDWDRATSTGVRSDLAVALEAGTWERVWSDADLTLRTRCPHYATCHYYRARREAAAAHVVVVNHALLLTDLHLRDLAGQGVLPAYRRLVLDEAHHLEDAATSVVSRQVTALGIRRAIIPLLGRKRRLGALDRLVGKLTGDDSPLDPDARVDLQTRAALARAVAEGLAGVAASALEEVKALALDDRRDPRRVTPEEEAQPWWTEGVAPVVRSLDSELQDCIGALQAVSAVVDGADIPAERAQPLLDLGRATRRLSNHSEAARAFLRRDDAECRWIEPARGRGERDRAALVAAPVDLAPTLERILWSRIPGSVCTSATMTVARRFSYWQRRVGLEEAESEVLPSPFDHAAQALLGLPRDLPPPNAPGYWERTAEAAIGAILASQGGAFVLCTSYRAVDWYAEALRAALPAAWPVLRQGTTPRPVLLQRFKESQRAVLVGTDSFWEGVSVKGEGLRLVIIPRLPFRVPTEPLQVARQEALQARGLDPFKAYSLPQAVIRLKQGYGRLIRSRSDRGVVLFLDRRLHDRSYGRIMLASIPPARRVSGPWRRVLEELERFFGP